MNLVMVGDSITQGGEDWSARLGRTDVLNAGQGGYSTGQMLWMFDDVVLAAEPEQVLIMGGINDLTLGVPIEQTLANVTEMVERLQAAGIEPVIQSTFHQHNNPGTFDIIQAHNARLRELADRKRVTFLDVNQVMSDESGLKPEFSRDGTHLTEAGYDAWAKFLRDHIAE